MWLNLAAVHERLATRAIGRRVVYYTSTGSTMDEARREAVEGAPAGTLVIAEEQTAGRGRFGRRWVSPAGQNLYFTLVLRPETSQLRRLAIISPLAVSRAVDEAAAVSSRLKWPNDVQLGGRKLAGVLIESEVAGAIARFSLVGIGINVNQRVLDPEIVDIATSLVEQTGVETAREALLAGVMNWFESLYEGDFAAARADWKGRLDTLGREVTVRCRDEVFAGRAEDVDAEGNLLLRLADGTLRSFEAGEVSLRG